MMSEVEADEPCPLTKTPIVLSDTIDLTGVCVAMHIARNDVIKESLR